MTSCLADRQIKRQADWIPMYRLNGIITSLAEWDERKIYDVDYVRAGNHKIR